MNIAFADIRNLGARCNYCYRIKFLSHINGHSTCVDCVEEGVESPRATRTFFSLRLTRSSTTFKAREYRETDAWIFYFDNDSIRRKEPATRSVTILFLRAETAERRGAETS